MKVPIIKISILNLQDLFSCTKVDWPKECKTEVKDGNLETIWLKIAPRSLSTLKLEIHLPKGKFCQHEGIFGLFSQIILSSISEAALF